MIIVYLVGILYPPLFDHSPMGFGVLRKKHLRVKRQPVLEVLSSTVNIIKMAN